MSKREREIERARANVSACMSTVGVFNEVFLDQLKGLDGCVCVRGRERERERARGRERGRESEREIREIHLGFLYRHEFAPR